jgi:hypothetical protein
MLNCFLHFFTLNILIHRMKSEAYQYLTIVILVYNCNFEAWRESYNCNFEFTIVISIVYQLKITIVRFASYPTASLLLAYTLVKHIRAVSEQILMVYRLCKTTLSFELNDSSFLGEISAETDSTVNSSNIETSGNLKYMNL